MPEPARKWRFQIHLSTAIILMFAAGGIIWLNLRERIVVIFISQSGCRHRGWPFTFVADNIYYFGNGPIPSTSQNGAYIFYGGLIVDLLFAVVVLLAVWFVCEWLIRRRAARKEL